MTWLQEKMPEIRKDYILDRFVIISTERSKRPDEFKKRSAQIICPFCCGNEHLTPPETERVGSPWVMRAIENKYSAVLPTGDPALRTDNDFYCFGNSVGKAEIIIETPIHSEQLWDFDYSRLSEVLTLHKRRIIELSRMPGVKYVASFKNHGPEAGASLPHSHSQLIAYCLEPRDIIDKEKAVAAYDSCPYCRIIQSEKGSYRAIGENAHAVAFTPYASRFPMEAWIFPKHHVTSIDHLGDDEITSIAMLLEKILKKLKSIDASYNFILQCGISDMHFHIEVLPRLSVFAGFELSTGTIINSMTPESAAEFYRKK